MPSVGELGEFGVIGRLEKLLGELGCLPNDGIGIGDDAALVPAINGQDWLITTDAQVEDVHFSSRWARPEEVGWRAMAANLSDIGAMGGRPHAVLVSLGLRAEMPIETIEGWYRGFARLLKPWGASVVGGNVTAVSGPAFIDITVMGHVVGSQAIRRNGASPGDAIVVSGYPGEAAAGVWCLEKEGERARDSATDLVRAYLEPQPRVALGMSLAQEGLATAMADTSDGLGADLDSICQASGCGAEIVAADLPSRAALGKYAGQRNTQLHQMVLGPSDDYQLVFTCRPQHLSAVMDLSGPACPLACIGRIEPGASEIWVVDGTYKNRWSISGWEHFSEG